jgi:hypothetical protein
MLRDQLAAALKDAMKAKNAERLSTVRLIQAAVKDRDIANRGTGKEEASDDEILQILAKMVKQRDESAKIYEENARPELAAKERAEITSSRISCRSSFPMPTCAPMSRRSSPRRVPRPEGHGQGHGGSEGALCRPDGFRQGLGRRQGIAELISSADAARLRFHRPQARAPLRRRHR